jgi:hypothetical protein
VHPHDARTQHDGRRHRPDGPYSRRSTSCRSIPDEPFAARPIKTGYPNSVKRLFRE